MRFTYTKSRGKRIYEAEPISKNKIKPLKRLKTSRKCLTCKQLCENIFEHYCEINPKYKHNSKREL